MASVYLILTTFPGRSVSAHSPLKYVHPRFLAYNIPPNFSRTFGTSSVSLTKPSAETAECHYLTFGPSLLCNTNLTDFTLEWIWTNPKTEPSLGKVP